MKHAFLLVTAVLAVSSQATATSSFKLSSVCSAVGIVSDSAPLVSLGNGSSGELLVRISKPGSEKLVELRPADNMIAIDGSVYVGDGIQAIHHNGVEIQPRGFSITLKNPNITYTCADVSNNAVAPIPRGPIAPPMAKPSVTADAGCAIVTGKGENIPFAKSSQRIDGEYATYEKGQIGSVSFHLRAGHGVIRLEARESGKLIATAWGQVIMQTRDGGALNLDVRSSTGQSYEAQCSDILGATGN